jgi:hypothetical protein
VDKDYVSENADEVLQIETAPDDRHERTDATTFLKEELKAGPLASNEVFKRARAEGISQRTLNRAKKDAGVISTQIPSGWVWSLKK